MNPSPSIGRIFSRDCLLAMTLCATVLAPSLAVLCERSQAAENPATRQAGNPQATPAPPPRITVSHETTRILRPLRGDGYVDYVAALNQMASQGVTPKNNAAVLFVQALGLDDFKPADRTRIDKLLQIEPSPQGGQHLADFNEFLNRKLGRRPTKRKRPTSIPRRKNPGRQVISHWWPSGSRAMQSRST